MDGRARHGEGGEVTGMATNEVEAVVARISLATAEDHEFPRAVTGELRALLSWWRTVSDGGAPRVAQVTASPASSDARASLHAGLVAADRAVDAGATLLIPRADPRDDKAARALIATLTRTEAPVVVPQPAGMTDRQWMLEVSAVRDDARRLSADRGDAVALLDGVGGFGIGFVVGVLLGAAARRTACLIDGTDESAAAVIADRLSSSAASWWMCGSGSADPARMAMAERVQLAPGLPLSLSDDVGMGAAATVALLRLLTE
jgi:nicotinate-nucleotide--dimethylbenzimidazole phosphoribosyltransferase